MDDHRPPHASRHHHHPHHRPARRRRSVFGWWLLLAFVGAGGLAWGVRSGFLKRAVGGPRPASQARRLEALRELRAQESAAREQERETRLAGIRAAIAQQKERADQALRDYQAFLESGGTAVLTVRRETMDQARRKAQEEEVAACEREVVAAQRLKRALSALKMQAMAYGSVAREIPEDSEASAEVLIPAAELEAENTQLYIGIDPAAHLCRCVVVNVTQQHGGERAAAANERNRIVQNYHLAQSIAQSSRADCRSVSHKQN